MPADGEEQQRRDSLWKLVDTQCAQLADSVAAARRPFLLGAYLGLHLGKRSL